MQRRQEAGLHFEALPNELIQLTLASLTIRELLTIQPTSKTMLVHARDVMLHKINHTRPPHAHFAGYAEAVLALQAVSLELPLESPGIITHRAAIIRAFNVWLKASILDEHLTLFEAETLLQRLQPILLLRQEPEIVQALFNTAEIERLQTLPAVQRMDLILDITHNPQMLIALAARWVTLQDLLSLQKTELQWVFDATITYHAKAIEYPMWQNNFFAFSKRLLSIQEIVALMKQAMVYRQSQYLWPDMLAFYKALQLRLVTFNELLQFPDNYFKAVRKHDQVLRFIKPAQIITAHQKTSLWWRALLSTKGLAALKEGLITFEQGVAIKDNEILPLFLNHAKSLPALRSGYITPTLLQSYKKSDIEGLDAALSPEQGLITITQTLQELSHLIKNELSHHPIKHLSHRCAMFNESINRLYAIIASSKKHRHYGDCMLDIKKQCDTPSYQTIFSWNDQTKIKLSEQVTQLKIYSENTRLLTKKKQKIVQELYVTLQKQLSQFQHPSLSENSTIEERIKQKLAIMKFKIHFIKTLHSQDKLLYQYSKFKHIIVNILSLLLLGIANFINLHKTGHFLFFNKTACERTIDATNHVLFAKIKNRDSSYALPATRATPSLA